MLPTRPRRAALALTALGLLAGTAAQSGAHAQEVGFFEALFGRARQEAPQPQMQPQVQAGSGGYVPSRRHDRGAARQRLRTRYAALPKSEPLKVKITDRQTPLDMSQGPAAALMKDETLRPGDIVILKSGPQVFTGPVEKRHTMRDFEPAQNSRLVDRRTRQQLAAMVAPVGALPADEARRVLARMKRTAPRNLAPVSAEARNGAEPAAMRVINVWSAQP
jgi:hypothetical protein